MKLKLFKAGDGDCCLISTGATHLLVDGGRSGAYEDHVAAELGRLHDAGERLARVCVSHIDEDHINGVLRMLDDKIDWKVHRFQIENGNPHHRRPPRPEPPDVDAVWHNGFSEVPERNTGDIIDQLAMRSAVLSLASGSALDEAEMWHKLVQGEEQAIRLKRRLSANQLGLRLNPERDGRLMGLFEDLAPLAVGGLTVRMIGPYFEDLEKLREDWQKWLSAHKDTLARIAEDAAEDEQNLGLTDVSRWLFRRQLQADTLGNTSKLTPPNVASIMFLVEENNQTILMTGDGGWDVILSGLENAAALRTDGSLHVNILKVPHHGSEFNTSPQFPRRITADHYLFCANGARRNPDAAVVAAYLSSRLGSPEERSPNPEAGRPFQFWFTHGTTDNLTTRQTEHMTAIVNRVTAASAANANRLQAHFVPSNTDFREIDLD